MRKGNPKLEFGVQEDEEDALVVVIFDLEFQSLLRTFYSCHKSFLKNLLQNMPGRQIVFLLKATFWEEEGFSVINGCLLKRKTSSFFVIKQQTKRFFHFDPYLSFLA